MIELLRIATLSIAKFIVSRKKNENKKQERMTRTFIWKTHARTLRKRDQAQRKPVFLKSAQKLNH